MRANLQSSPMRAMTSAGVARLKQTFAYARDSDNIMKLDDVRQWMDDHDKKKAQCSRA